MKEVKKVVSWERENQKRHCFGKKGWNGMEEKRKIILDVDTGTDDAVAIMMAYLEEKIDLLAVCTVVGNKPLENTTENTLRVKELLGADFPVYRGCGEAMVCNLNPNRHAQYKGVRTKVGDMQEEVSMHTEYLDLPASTSTVEREHAVFYYIDTLMHSEGDITLVPVGPLTNLAMAMRLEPQICGKIKEIVMMGGGCRRTNSTAAAEFNIWHDPEAAQIVMDSGVPIRMVPLDATHNACVSTDDTKAFRAMGSAVGKAIADFTDHRIFAYSQLQPMERIDSAPVHDALAVCAVAYPEVLKDIFFTRVDIDISGGFSDGQTIVDPRTFVDKPRNVHFAFDADGAFFVNWMKVLAEKA